MQNENRELEREIAERKLAEQAARETLHCPSGEKNGA